MSARRSIALLALLAGPLGACSLLLDPGECESDGDCVAPGVCQDGICVGEPLPNDEDTGVAPDAAPDTGTPGPDAGGPDGGPDGSAPDQGVEGDAGAPDMGAPAPPRCAIIAPAPTARLTGQATVEVTVEVADDDTPREALVVRVNGTDLALAADGTATLVAELREGDNAFELTVEDDRGQTCTDRIVVVSDRSGPTILREEPAADHVLVNEETATVRACIDDPHGVQSVHATLRGLEVPADDLRADGRCRMPCTGECVEFDVTLAPGENPLTLRAVDTLGNESAADAFVLAFDGTPPEIVVEAPADGAAVVQRNIEVRGRVTEPDGDVRQVNVRVRVTGPRPGETREQGAQVDAQGHFSIPALPLYGGANTLRACATDAAANESCREVSVFVELEPPCVAISRPQDDALLGAGDVEVCGTSCPSVQTVRVEAGDLSTDAVRQANGDWCGTLRLPDGGEYAVRAVATSRAGQVADASVDVRVDETGPVVAIDQPAPGACLGGQTVRVCGRATDPEVRVTGVRLHPGNVLGDPRANDGFCADVPMPEGADQPITAVATNAAGLVGEASVPVTVDRTGPRLEFDFDEGAFVGADEAGRVALEGRVADDGCGVPGNGLVVDGRPVLVGAGGRFTVRHALPAGQNDLNFTATDTVGNVTHVRRRVVVDATPPTIEVVAPASGTATVADTIEVRARVADVGSGVARVTIGGVEATLEEVGGDTVATARVPLLAGDNRITVEAVDQVGLVGRGFVDVLRDLDAPSVVVETPLQGAAVESRLFVAGTADDGVDGSGVASVTVNGVAAQLAEDGRSWSVAGVPLTAGDNELQVVATDRAGNVSAPVGRTVHVRTFAATDPARVGLGLATDVAWVGSADLDGDGHLDLVALSGAAGGVSAVYLQQDDATFVGRDALAAGLPPGGGVRAAAFGDFDADGHADLAVGFADGVEVWLGRGDGGFTLSGAPGAPVDLDVRDLAVGDVNRDGHLDLLVLAGPDSVLLHGDGAGGFNAAEAPADRGLEGAGDATAALLFDLTGDRLQDAVLVGADTATLFVGDREGDFAAVDPVASGFADLGAARLVAIDADRDGDLDLFAAGDTPRFYLASAEGASWTVDARGLVPGGATPWAAVADFDADGRDDLAVGGAAGLEVWRSGAGGFTRLDAAQAGLPPLTVSGPLLAADLDGDGDFDLVVTTPDGLRLVRSNRSASPTPHRFVRLHIRRARAQQPGPFDAVGVRVTADYDDDLGADRALVAAPFGPTLVTLGAAATVNLVVHYIDKGPAGLDRRNLEGRQAGAVETVHALE